MNHERHEMHEKRKFIPGEFFRVFRVFRVFRGAMLLILLFASAAFAQQKVVPDKSYIRFVSKQMNVPVEGKFRKFDATVAFDPQKPEATKAEFEVDLASIDLGTPEGETEVVRPLWFDTAKFPKAKLVASAVKATGPGKFEATGALTIKGTTQNITTAFTLAEAGEGRTVEARFTFKRLQLKR